MVVYAVHLQLETAPVHLWAQFSQKILEWTEAQACRLGTSADSHLDNEISQRSQRLWVTSRVLVGRPFRAIALRACSIVLPGPSPSLDNLPMSALLSVA